MKPNRKAKKQCSSSKLILEEIIGLTTKNGNGLASNVSISSCAYAAGCVVVVYNVETGKQSHLMVSHRAPKPLSCVAVSRDGRFIAAAESGNQPSVLVWECSTLSLISELKDHLYGVECIAFSPDGEHLASVGGYIYLWNWRSGVLVTKLKASSSCSAVTSVSFSADAKFVITAGKKHLKFWTIGSSPKTRLNKGSISLTMHSKPVNLGPQKGRSFASVASAVLTNSGLVNSKQACDLFPVYALTDEGVLCIVDNGLEIRKSVDLKVEKGFALSASDKLIACACCKGIVRLFTSESLNYFGTLLYSKAKSFQGETEVVYHPSTIEKDFQHVPALPDAVACQFSSSEKLVVVYGDHALYIWDIHDMNKVTKCCVLFSHSACIWDVNNLCCENMHDPSLACVARGCDGGISFATCSADGTIRLWDLALQPDAVNDDSGNDLSNTACTARLVSGGIFERDTMEASTKIQGFRSMAVSLDGKYLAAGDCEGNLHIYDLHASDYTFFKGVHDAEILSLGFSLSNNKCDFSEDVKDGNYFLASGGRDRIIHLYDVRRNFDLIQSIDDHSAAVTSVKVIHREILSCSADRSLVFRKICSTDTDHKIMRRQQICSHGTIHDMAIDPTREFIVTVGQDKKINTFNIASRKLMRSFKQDKDYGDPIKVTMDPSYSYLACSYSNKSLCLYDSISGEMVAQVMGHGEVVTGVIFLQDCKHIVSVGADGCIFIWKLPARISSIILQRMKENYGPLTSTDFFLPAPFTQIVLIDKEDDQGVINSQDVHFQEANQVAMQVPDRGGGSQRTPTFRFSISRLPMWAQSKVTPADIQVNPNFSFAQPPVHLRKKVHTPVTIDGGQYDPLCHEAKTSRSLDVQGNSSCLSSLSKSSGNYSNRTSTMTKSAQRDEGWLNIYTVCLDLFDSPEGKFFAAPEMPSFSCIQNPAHISGGGDCAIGNARELVNYARGASSRSLVGSYNGFMDNFDHKLVINNTSICHEDVSACLPKQLQKAMSVDCYLVKSKNNGLHMQNFGNLSTSRKVEIGKSSIRRRYNAGYTVRLDCSGNCRKLFDSPALKEGKSLKQGRNNVNRTTPVISEIQSLEEEQETYSFTQDIEDSPRQGESTKGILGEKSMNIMLQPAMNQKNRLPEMCNFHRKTNACMDALLHLNDAAQNVFNLFTELETEVSKESTSNGCGTKLYDEAGKLIPKIAEKLNAVSELVQRRSNSSGSGTVHVPGFEPLLESFAENLSQRVVEMVKKNLNKD